MPTKGDAPAKKSAPEVTKKNLPSFIKKGKDSINQGGGTQFVRLPAGEQVQLVPLTGLDEMISYDQHSIWLDGGNSPQFPCSQTPDCPGCMIGDKPRARGLLNVYANTEEGKKVQVWGFGMSIMKLLAEIEESLDGGDLQGKVLKVKKTGSGLGTKYSVIPTANTVKEMPSESEHINLVELVGETDRDKIIEQLTEAGKWKTSKKSKPLVEDEDDDVTDEDDETIEDGELDDDDEWA